MTAQQPDVQAFIPTLAPSHQVEPIYPDAARSERIQGMVQLLVTISPQGIVTNVEPLTGRDIFWQPAADAVRQWVFRPVIRNGTAVFAMTSTMVHFFLPPEPGQPKTTPDLGLNISDQMAASRRTADLERKFPRSPELVLADLENAAAGDTGMHRFYELPGLAKAAVKAGDLSKAQAYASELLSMAPEHPRDWNYGNAIHDGNMVLGLVTLHQGDAASAKKYLLDAGKTPGSPQLNSFGPNASLAKELLEKNERDAVLEYFTLCGQFWKTGADKLKNWTAMVRGGGVPDFGANLVY
ncbi:MAG TPA: TonB family protein [Bryobacteraceae bacterium]|nr:TonB family protein [Bryobacteraceae bacterium]